MISSPIQVYLDSSDYSTLSRPFVELLPEDRAVLEWLRQNQRRGTIEIRYSMVHLVEACHRDVNSKESAVARAKLIGDLSDTKVMRSIPDIVCSEAGVANRPIDVIGHAFDNHGKWYPPVGPLAGAVQLDLRRIASDTAVATGGNRAARRAAKSIVGTRTRRQNLIQQFCADTAALARLCESHGMPPRVAQRDLFLKIFGQDRSDKEIEELLCSEIFAPRHLVEDYLDRFERARSIRSSVRGLGERLVGSVDQFRESLDSARKRGDSSLEMQLQTLRRNDSSEFDQFREQLTRTALRIGSQSSIEGVTNAPKAGECVGIEVLAGFIENWFKDLIGGANVAGRAPQPSDAGDALHAFYLPYVDVWRGDRYACNALRDLARRFGTLIAPTLRGLPASLDALIRG